MFICRNNENFRQIILYTSLNLYDLCLKNVSSALKKVKNMYVVSNLDILFLSNHNIHKSLCGLCFWAPDALIGPGAHEQSPNELL